MTRTARRLAPPEETPLLDPMAVPAFVQTRPVCIVRVGEGPDPDFHPAIRGLAHERGGATARVARDRIDMTNWLVAGWVRSREATLGLEPLAVVRAGYYLFVDAKIAGYHPALPDLREDRATIFGGLLVGILGAAFDSPVGMRLGVEVASVGAPARAISFFEGCISRARWAAVQERVSRRIEEERARQRLSEEHALRQACRTLGVTADASVDMVKKAHRKLAKKHHPDKMSHDPGAHDRMIAITKARDFLLERHKRRKK